MSASPPTVAQRRIAWPGLRQVLFQLHWFFGITAGTLLIVIGLTGAALTFRDEITDAITPGGRHVPVAGTPALTPQQLVDALRVGHGGRQVGSLTLSSEPGRAARVMFAPPPGQRRGESVYVNPYTGETLPKLGAEPFFAWVESLHRWLLLPREAGRIVAGILAASLLLLSLSGLYLRWPRHPLRWRAWLTFDTGSKGRSFLWGLHSVAGTLALVVYVMFTTTGLYWAYDWIRDPIDRAAGDPRPATQPPRPKAPGADPRAEPPAVDLGPAWQAFVERAAASGGWAEVGVRLPNGHARSLQLTWLAHGAPHERARNRMTVALAGGAVIQDERYLDRSASQQALTVIYPLHLGSYFGVPGKIVNLLAALMLPLFAVTGWMLYLDRRRKKREVSRQQAAWLGSAAPRLPDAEPVLLAWASQTGTAEGIALRTAATLRTAGVAVTVMPFAELDPERLRQYPQLLLVASSFGEGEPPDSARRAARLFGRATAPALGHLRYGLLALGDRHYEKFCGFGHALDHALESAGASRMFPTIEVDDGDPAALEAWRLALAPLAGQAAIGSIAADGETAALQDWQLVEREHLNPGSQGEPLYRIDLLPLPGASMHWQAGALVDVVPGTPVGASQAHAPRRYSIASLPGEGRLRLLVRQVQHEGGLGLGSGWLTAHAPMDARISLRLVANPAFAPADDEAPALFIGNGSGYAGLRGHLLARVAAGRQRNWLIFGERQRAHDAFCEDELQAWQTQGFLPDYELVFSRDQADRRYVQDALRAQAERVRSWVGEGACVYVCGSLVTMAAGVDAALADILGADGLDDLIASGRYRRDVY